MSMSSGADMKQVAQLEQAGQAFSRVSVGAGGSLGFCDQQSGIAFGYVTNDMGPRWQNPRNRALIDAVYAAL